MNKMTRCWLLEKSESYSHNHQLAADLVSAVTFEYRALGRGNDVRILKVGENPLRVIRRPAIRHGRRRDGRKFATGFFPSLSAALFSLPGYFLLSISTPVTYVARKIAAERFARYSFCTPGSLVPLFLSPLHPPLSLSLFLTSLPVPGYAPGGPRDESYC